MKSWDKQARHKEVQDARDAKSLMENPILEAWKEETKEDILKMLLNAPMGYEGEGERLAAQCRLHALNELGASLSQRIATGGMAEKQLSEERKRDERKNPKLQEVAR